MSVSPTPSWLRAGKLFDVLVASAPVIDGAAAREADKGADTARVGDQAAELAITNLLLLDGADRSQSPGLRRGGLFNTAKTTTGLDGVRQESACGSDSGGGKNP
jgi:hypothetical protein